MSIFGELKHRNVFRVGIAYLAVAWLIAQVLQLVFESFATPTWVMKSILVLMAVGFPIALLFAWAFELTPDGLKREHEVTRSKSVTAGTGKKLDRLIIVVLIAALGYFAYDKFVLSPTRSATAVAVATSSIAVLPFVNLSSDQEQVYFSDGLSEELLNLLSRIPELKVTSRSSSFSFRGEQIDIPEIAEKLNVSHILEGAVRRSGDQLRVTAQLIDARSDTHLWSETYERTLDDIFAIQDNIATAVVAQLRVELLGDVPITEAADPTAFAYYLQARYLANLRSSEAWEKSNAIYLRALEIDPRYTAALTGLASNYRDQAGQGLIPTTEGFERARKTAEMALAINPDYAEAHAVMGTISDSYDRDMRAAARHYEKALALDPTNIGILANAGSLAHQLGRLDEATKVLEYVVARDPVNPRTHWSLGYSYEVAERWDDAIRSFRTALLLSPKMGVTRMAIGVNLLEKDEPQEALAAIQEEPFEAWRLMGLVMAHYALDETDKSDAALAKLINKYEVNASYNIAAALAYRNESDRAFEWLEKAVHYKDPGVSEITRHPFWFRNIHGDSRWLPFLESIGHSRAQLDAISFQFAIPE